MHDNWLYIVDPEQNNLQPSVNGLRDSTAPVKVNPESLSRQPVERYTDLPIEFEDTSSPKDDEEVEEMR